VILYNAQKAAERKARKTEWHRHFAWTPTTLLNRDVVWLESVLRILIHVRSSEEFRYVYMKGPTK
jgi:hypothetical protein